MNINEKLRCVLNDAPQFFVSYDCSLSKKIAL